MAIPCHLTKFYLFFMPKHDMDFRQAQVMEFGVISDQNAVNKTRGNPRHIFYREFINYFRERDVPNLEVVDWRLLIKASCALSRPSRFFWRLLTTFSKSSNAFQHSGVSES